MSELYNTVLVDMDGVMANFDASALAGIPEVDRVPKIHFYVTDHYNAEQSQAIKLVHNAPGFFEDLEPMPGLLEGWQTLIDNGYDPRVASAPLSANPNAVEEKIKWLDRIMIPEFGPKIVEDAIIDKHKWKYKGLALLDDRPDVPRGIDGANVAEWEHILFGWAHLAKVPMATSAFRLLSWYDTDELLKILDVIGGA